MLLTFYRHLYAGTLTDVDGHLIVNDLTAIKRNIHTDAVIFNGS